MLKYLPYIDLIWTKTSWEPSVFRLFVQMTIIIIWSDDFLELWPFDEIFIEF